MPQNLHDIHAKIKHHKDPNLNHTITLILRFLGITLNNIIIA